MGPSFAPANWGMLELAVQRCGEERRSALRRGLALAGALALALPLAAGRAEAGEGDGLRVSPSLGWSSGNHSLDLMFASRFRTEWWDAHAPEWDTFYALRTRVGARYSYKNRLSLFAEFQDTHIWDLGSNASGAGFLYWRFGGFESSVHGDDLRQAWVELRPGEGIGVRAGRQDINLGTQAPYPEANWGYLKVKRASQRLVGTVGWTHGERSNDGLTGYYETDDHHLYAFVAMPTTGVFDVNDAYKWQDDILYGGISWTVKRRALIPNTEIRSFLLGYRDHRSTSKGGLPDDVEIYTAGFSTIGIHPLGPGNADLLIWAAIQMGDYNDEDHLAGAGIVEAGYQLAEAPFKPWLRAGINIASGDDDLDDGEHNTFFNMLPTNHLYYGFADRLAFQNLMDVFAQLKLRPHERVDFDLFVHHFRRVNKNDTLYSGTGAFSREGGSFGYAPIPTTTGGKRFGTEVDAVVSVSICPNASISAGYSRMWGHEYLSGMTDQNVDFAFAQLALKY